MKPLLRLLAASTLLLTAVSSNAASTFEGKVSQTLTDGKGKSHDVNYSIKSPKMRMDVSEGDHAAVMIMDTEKFEMLILIEQQHMYMVMPMKKPVEQAIEKSGDANVDVQVSGKTDTILGYKCNQVLITDKTSGTVTEAWLAPELGTFMGFGSGGGSPFGGRKPAASAKWEEALKGKAGFPLRIIAHDAKGKESFKLETTKLEAGSLPDAVFTPPADYKKFDMPNMGALMKGMGGQ
ncbi:MAG: DUF4412 domain-containing protein [Lacunisphaera sp.]